MTEQLAAGSDRTSDCGSRCGCLGDPGARSEREGEATRGRAAREITRDSYQAMLGDLEPRAGAE